MGPEKALEVILSGEPFGSEEALRHGVIDEIVRGDLIEAAVTFARGSRVHGRPPALVRDREDKIADLRANPQAFEAAASKALGRRGRRAQVAVVEAVRQRLGSAVRAGIGPRAGIIPRAGRDRQIARRNATRLRRAGSRAVPDMPAGTKPRPVSRAVVIGAGTMGGGIAMSFANVGISGDRAQGESQPALDSGLDRVARNYRTTVARGRLTEAQMHERLALISRTLDFAVVAEADVVIEAVFEEMSIKKQLFGELDRLAKPGTLLASNTSTLDIDEIARSTHRPDEVLGTHFFSPANVMRLLEIVRGRATSFTALASAIALGRKLTKVPVVVGNCDGFVGNRMLARRSVEAERLLLEGALPQEVDAAVVEFGFPMGPFAMSDLAGNDVGWRIRRARGTKAAVADALCEAGRFGQKTGRGYFIYQEGSRTPTPDPAVENIIIQTSQQAGISRRSISKEEIVERMIYPMINEGARILQERIAYRPGDIDVIWIYGYGWPIWRGGPMFYADLVGLPQIRDRLAYYAGRSGDPTLEPAPLLARLAAEGQGFASLKAAAAAGSSP